MNTGYLETLLNALPAAIKAPMVQFTREAFKTLRFGAPDTTAVAAENFGGHLVPVTTSSTPDQEVAVAHGLARVPRLMLPALDPGSVNATLPQFTVTQVPDATYLYLSSPVVTASFTLYVE